MKHQIRWEDPRGFSQGMGTHRWSDCTTADQIMSYKDTYVCGIVGFIICILVGTRTDFVSPRSRCRSVFFFSCALDLDPWYIPNTKSYKLNMLRVVDILCSYHDEHRPSFPRHGLFMACGRFVLIVGPVYEPAFHWEGPTLFPCSFLLVFSLTFPKYCCSFGRSLDTSRKSPRLPARSWRSVISWDEVRTGGHLLEVKPHSKE